MPKPRTYTIEIAGELAEHWADWRPLSELADSMKIKLHADGTAEMLLRWEADRAR